MMMLMMLMVLMLLMMVGVDMGHDIVQTYGDYDNHYDDDGGDDGDCFLWLLFLSLLLNMFKWFCNPCPQTHIIQE